eukprot:3941943-Rhodomonas_salina.5
MDTTDIHKPTHLGSDADLTLASPSSSSSSSTRQVHTGHVSTGRRVGGSCQYRTAYSTCIGEIGRKVPGPPESSLCPVLCAPSPSPSTSALHVTYWQSPLVLSSPFQYRHSPHSTSIPMSVLAQSPQLTSVPAQVLVGSREYQPYLADIAQGT